jgi:hypothetical protein
MNPIGKHTDSNYRRQRPNCCHSTGAHCIQNLDITQSDNQELEQMDALEFTSVLIMLSVLAGEHVDEREFGDIASRDRTV